MLLGAVENLAFHFQQLSAVGILNYHNGFLPIVSHKGQGQEIMEEWKGILTSLNQSLLIGSRD